MTDQKPVPDIHLAIAFCIACLFGIGEVRAAVAADAAPPVNQEVLVEPSSAPVPAPVKEAKKALAAPKLGDKQEADVSAVNGAPATVADPDDEAAVENAEAEQAAVARPVSPDLVRIYGWRERILVHGIEEKLQAKLDTGALTSSIHAEEKELFERDGKKWVRFIVTDPSLKKPARTRVEAPLIRIARIKEPGGESVAREVVRLSFQLGEKKLRGDFTLNNRSNMLSPVLIGRNMIKDLGWVDPGRTYLAEQNIFR